MKIVILMPMGEQRGGGELMLQQLLKYGQHRGVEWFVVFLEDGPLIAEFERLGVRTQLIRTGRLRQLHLFPRAVSAIAATLRRERADLVVSWSGKPHLYGSLAGIAAGVKSAWYQLGYPVGRHLSKLDRIVTMLPARGVITLSEAGSRGQQQLWPRRPVHLVYPSVDLADFDPARLSAPAEARRELGLPAEGRLIGIVGRLQRWKGMHVLIEAFPRILEAHPDVHCVVVGGEHALEAEYAEALKRQVQDPRLRSRVLLAGFQRNVPAWMQAMDVVVHASDNEPFGIVVIEAMALGKPVVAGDQGGPREIITEGTDGLLAPYGDAGALAGQINRLLGDPELMRRVGAAARTRALDFAPERYAERFIAAVGELSR